MSHEAVVLLTVGGFSAAYLIAFFTYGKFIK